MSAVMCLTTGVTLCIGKKFSGSNFWTDVRDSRATVFVYVGEAVRYLMAAPPSPLDKKHNLRIAFGNGLRPDVWERFRQRFGVETIHEFFNSTEGVLSLINSNRGLRRSYRIYASSLTNLRRLRSNGGRPPRRAPPLSNPQLNGACAS